MPPKLRAALGSQLCCQSMLPRERALGFCLDPFTGEARAIGDMWKRQLCRSGVGSQLGPSGMECNF